MSDSNFSGLSAGTNRRDFIAGGTALGMCGLARIAAGQESAVGRISDALSQPDFALINGQFIDYRGNVGAALSISNGRIQAIGSGASLDPAVPVIDLGGRTVIPGFIDAHVHYTRAGVNPGYQERRIERAFSIAELQETLARRAATVPPG